VCDDETKIQTLRGQIAERERFQAKACPALDAGWIPGSREENASKQEARASVLIQSEPMLLLRSSDGSINPASLT
jgi:hypothetical protein